MEQRINIAEWQQHYWNGDWDNNEVRVQIKAGWYDWFCKDSSLKNKTLRMGRIIQEIKAGGKVNLKDWYVWFKNNCPLNGPLYDDFRIADLETGEVQLTIQLDCCWNQKKYAVYGRREPGAEFQSDTPLFETDSTKELIKWLNEPWEK